MFVKGSVLDGWNLITRKDQQWNHQGGFEVWASGDQMEAADGQTFTVSAAPGDGSKFLELSGANDETHSQTLGISRQVSTVAGDTYALSFDLAGQPGFDAASTFEERQQQFNSATFSVSERIVNRSLWLPRSYHSLE
ncbi:hypothetical protein [Sulfuriferula nivalis]|uniref:DUF642 domain-containing protein n=1 Tax=Sulfuriferula nivalis TaxID=2675298 RepID=A0A809SDS2_9PROT|nr:hypothetical protein [Sulfuriferula nivalis]BBP00807.1 hypothetical protein SFSGTM_15150 [Sulfuriferula nivalis]